jgi:glycosyltransferase involved in cell wall biosynthesis
MGVVHVLRVIPQVRSSDFERSRQSANRIVIFVSRYADLDESSVWPTAKQVRRAWAWRWAFQRRWEVVELPEPLWLRALPLTVSVGLAVRLSDLVQRRRTRIVTYGMENSDPDMLMVGIPTPLHRLVFGVIRRLCTVIYDRIAFASESARNCYTATRVLPVRCTTGVFEELPEACRCHRGQPKVKQFAFVGALEPRKGLPDLLAAWEEGGLGGEGWQLAIAGSGPLADDLAAAAAADPSIIPLGPINRRQVHDVMARTAVAVLPSRRWGRWREQIGNSIAEGLAHGCHIVATPDSGLAGWLRRNGHEVLPEDFAVAHLRDAMRRVAISRLSPTTVEESLPPLGGRTAAEDWMCANEASAPARIS